MEDDQKQYDLKALLESAPKNRQENITQAYTNLVIGVGLTFNLSDHHLFKEFIKSIDDKIKIPGRKSLMNSIAKEFEGMQQRIKKKLKNCEMVHLTADMWSNKGLKSSFIGMTAHIYDSDDKCKRNFILCLREFNESHGANQIIAKILNLLEEFNIRKKVKNISTDGGRNIRRAILDISSMEEIETSLFDEETEYDDTNEYIPGIDIWLEDLFKELRRFNIQWLGCFCHRLQIVVLKGIKVRSC